MLQFYVHVLRYRTQSSGRQTISATDEWMIGLGLLGKRNGETPGRQ